MIPGKADILVLGDTWTGPLFAYALRQLNQKCDLWVSEFAAQDALEAVCIGNGETRDKAGQIFGEHLARALWKLSEENKNKAQTLFSELEVPVSHSADAVVFSSATLAHSLSRGLSPNVFSTLQKIEQTTPFSCRVHLKTQKGVEVAEAALVVVVTESYSLGSVAELSDTRIPATLSSFTFTGETFPAGYHSFNQGAEFCISDGKKFRLGSLRNLFSDRGVGLHTSIDEVTRKNILEFFSKQGGISLSSPYEAVRRVEALSCDGIPLVGTYPGLPGCVFVTGFAARGPCFLFSVAESVAQALVGKPSGDLSIFSTRRLL